MEFTEDTLFEGITVKRGDNDGPPLGEVLIYEERGRIGVAVHLADALDAPVIFHEVWPDE